MSPTSHNTNNQESNKTTHSSDWLAGREQMRQELLSAVKGLRDEFQEDLKQESYQDRAWDSGRKHAYALVIREITEIKA